MSSTRQFVAALILLLWCFTPTRALAHERSTSWSSWTLNETGGQVRLRIPSLEMTRLTANEPEQLAEYLTEHLTLERGDSPCDASLFMRQAETDPGWSVFHWTLRCPEGGDFSVHSSVLQAEVPSHLHFTTVIDVRGQRWDDVLTRDHRTVEILRGQQNTNTSIARFVGIGVEHIAFGWDHLAFVFVLLLLARRFRDVLALVTAFTLAHSLTLGLAVTGVVQPDPVAVEILIGFSIALVAIENGWELGGRDHRVPLVLIAAVGMLAVLGVFSVGQLRPVGWVGVAIFSMCHFGLLRRVTRIERVRAMVAFAFGLFHGFGFAGVLLEVDVDPDRLLPSLFGFNIGVEIGQLVVVALVWPVLRGLERVSHRGRRHFDAVGSAAALALGVFWTLTRAFG